MQSIANNQIVVPDELLIGIRAGMVPGFSVRDIAGISETISSGAPQNINGTVDELFYPSTDEALSVASTSVNDTAAGTGAQLVIATLMDSAGAETTVGPIALNGQTPVSLGTGYRLQALLVLTAGSLEKNDGIIYVGATSDTFTNGVPTEPYLSIFADGSDLLAAGFAQAALFTVPAGERMFAASLNISGQSNNPVILYVQARAPGGAWLTLIQLQVDRGAEVFTIYGGTAIGPMSDIRLMSKGNSGGNNFIMAIGALVLQTCL